MPTDTDGKAADPAGDNAGPAGNGADNGNPAAAGAATAPGTDAPDTGKAAEPSFYDGNPLSLDPAVYETHYKPMQAQFTKRTQALAVEREQIAAEGRRLAEERADLDRQRAALYRGTEPPSTSPPSRVEAWELPADDFKRHVDGLIQGNRRDEAASLVIRREMAPVLKAATEPLMKEIESLRSQLGAVTPTVQMQQRMAEISASWRSLVDENPAFGAPEVRAQAEAALRSPDADTAALLDSDNPAHRRAALRFIAMNAASAVESSRRAARADRATDGRPPSAPAKPATEAKRPNSLDTLDLITHFLTPGAA
jgi:hypothetical protein